MRCRMLLAPAAAAAMVAAPAWAGEGEHVILPSDDVSYSAGPPSLPEGAEFAILHGDPSTEGLFGMRLRLPDGYHIPPHIHSQFENGTVLSGTFHVGMGDEADRDATETLEEGGVFSFPPGHSHYVWTEGETVIQLNSTGPWTIEYIDSEDDPRV